MRHQFFTQAKAITPYAVAFAGVSLFSVFYLKATVHAYRDHCEHIKKYPDIKKDSTLWSRFSHTYLPLFPLIPVSSSSSHGMEGENKSRETCSK